MAHDLALSNDGGVFVTGRLYSEEAIFGPETENEIWLDEEGERQWTSVTHGTDTVQDLVLSLNSTSGGGLIAGGCFSGKKMFGFGESGESELVSLSPFCDGYISHHGSDGKLDWALRVAS